MEKQNKTDADELRFKLLSTVTRLHDQSRNSAPAKGGVAKQNQLQIDAVEHKKSLKRIIELIVFSKKTSQNKKADFETAAAMLSKDQVPVSVLLECGTEAKIYTRQRAAATHPYVHAVLTFCRVFKQLLLQTDLRKRRVAHYYKMQNIAAAQERIRMLRRKTFNADKKSYNLTRMPSMTAILHHGTPHSPDNERANIPKFMTEVVEEHLDHFKVLLPEPLMERLIQLGLELTLKAMLEGKEVDPVQAKNDIIAISKPVFLQNSP